MSLQTTYVQDELKLLLSVTCSDISRPSVIERTFGDLDHALDQIEEKLDARDIFFYQIAIDIPGEPPAPGAYNPYEGLDYYLARTNPWTSFAPKFWEAALKDVQLRQRAMVWLVRMEEVLLKAAALRRPTESLWEDDETQLGEPIASHLALIDLSFVPYYTQLLRLWDHDTAMETGQAVLPIVKRHGLCQDIQDMIGCFTIEVDGAPEVRDALRELTRP